MLSTFLTGTCYILGTIMTISKDRVKPSPLPDSWKLAEIFTTGVVLGSYLAMMTVIFFWAAYKTDFFPVSSSASYFLWKKEISSSKMCVYILSGKYTFNFTGMECV